MNNALDIIEYALRVLAAAVLTLFSMVFAVFIGLFTMFGEGLAWCVKELVKKYDETDENVKEEVTTEE